MAIARSHALLLRASLALLCAAPAGAGEALFSARQLQPLPAPPGVAGAFAGVVGGRLVVAGGANFPDRMPWEGGTKTWTDRMWMLPATGGTWRTCGRLARPNAYGVSISLPQGLLCIGGGNAERSFAEVFLICSGPFGLCIDEWPALPAPAANGCGALVGNKVYVAGGVSSPTATVAIAACWVLDLTNRIAGWREVPPCPGPARQLAVAAGGSNAFYLISGTSLAAGPDGKPARTYLDDAWRFEPGTGWRRLASLPHPVAAAPTPAATLRDDRLVIFGGDAAPSPDPSRHAGFRNEMLAFDPATDRWTDGGWMPAPRVTTPGVMWQGTYVIPSGEARRGVRSCEVWMYTPTAGGPP